MVKRLLVKVIATQVEDQVEPDDADVSGIYFILLNSDVDIVEAADVALDVFHSRVPVKILDDFGFTVLHGEDQLFGLDDWESYSGSNRGALVEKRRVNV